MATLSIRVTFPLTRLYCELIQGVGREQTTRRVLDRSLATYFTRVTSRAKGGMDDVPRLPQSHAGA